MGGRISCKGGNNLVFLLLLDCGEKPVPEYLHSDAAINFVEGNDNEEADNNLYFIGADVDGSCECSFHIDVR